MKAKLEFDLDDPYEEENLKHALNGSKYKHIIDDIWQNVFRPNRKHGYGNKILDTDEAHNIIEELITIYLRTIEDINEL